MRRFILLLAIALVPAAALSAQPRSVGVRMGYYFDAMYQHDLSQKFFVDAALGTSVNGDFRVSSTVNGVFYSFDAPEAYFNLYWSAGLAMGYMGDNCTVDVLDLPVRVEGTFYSKGFAFGFVPGIGIECDFNIPLQLSLDIRPVIGFHVAEGYNGRTYANFYDNGLFGFIPSISVRYRF